MPHDSRCPVNVQCITAGNAVARLRLGGGESGEATAELNTTVGPKEASHGTYTVRLVALRPEPTAGIPIRQTSYRAIVQATRG
ncbi:MAG TPA: hypothetical protein VF121_09530 [Thermoanaerobaculia bacterium]|nr:hypothetical protein [Thermoanaerobaculia bacterium]